MRAYTKTEIEVERINEDYREGRLIVDPSYQRRKVWNNLDKVRLIETILMDYVVPEVFFWHVNRDPETGRAITHIVDGQQRIASLVEFVNNEFPLSKKSLLSQDAEFIEKYGDKFFSDLDKETRNKIWGYHLTVVTLDDNYNIDTIKEMFYRLNLTDYNLNAQERRNSKDSAFGAKCIELSELEFWECIKVFSSKDYKRMLDVEFCATIFILANEFIVNQTDNRIIDQYYEDYKDAFDDDSILLNKIIAAMSLIEELRDSDTASFLSKKVQLYTLFSITMEMVTNGKGCNEGLRYRFTRFCTVYSKFKNEYVYESKSEENMVLYDKIKQYKLASSEGVNKVKNRMIRYEILNDFLFSDSFDEKPLNDIESFFEQERKKKKFAPVEEEEE